ncbi:MAG: type II toxin-antitoxin system HicA family toxin [Opitutales bacterium]
MMRRKRDWGITSWLQFSLGSNRFDCMPGSTEKFGISSTARKEFPLCCVLQNHRGEGPCFSYLGSAQESQDKSRGFEVKWRTRRWSEPRPSLPLVRTGSASRLPLISDVMRGKDKGRERIREGIAAVKVREVLAVLKEDGWYQVRQRASHRQYKHPTRPGTVTVAGKPGVDIPAGTLKISGNKPESKNGIHSSP